MSEIDQDQAPRAQAETASARATPAGADMPDSTLEACRRRLPSRRWHTIIRFAHKEHEGDAELEYDLTIGFYPDGLVGEIFLDGAAKQRDFKLKVGSALEAFLDDQAELCSLLMQLGVRPAALLGHFTQGTILRRAIALVAEVEAAGGVKLYTPAPAIEAAP